MTEPSGPQALPHAAPQPSDLSPERAPVPSRAPVVLLAAALGLLLLAVLAYLLGARSVTGIRPLPGEPPTPTVRPLASLFTLPSLQGGGTVSLADHRGQVVVLNFFASWCGPCALEAATLERSWLEHSPHGVVFLGVAVQDRFPDAQAFLRRHGISYPAGFDATGRVMQDYRVTGIPTTVFIDPDGRIAGRHMGIFVGDAGLERLTERIAATRRMPR